MKMQDSQFQFINYEKTILPFYNANVGIDY